MSNSFINAMDKQVAWKTTENGLDALNTTFDACLDLFSTIGALRSRKDAEINEKVANAYAESPLVCMKTLFYARDIDEGLGERHVFRVGLRYLAETRSQDVALNLENIVKFGRFDDLYLLVGTPLENKMWELIIRQWNEDIAAYRENKPLSLMAKWLKSVNTSSKESVVLGKKTAKALGLSEREYRKNLSLLRKRIQIVEEQMSNNDWDKVDFTTVPGGAMKKYNKAFYRHQEQRYTQYINAVNSKTDKLIEVNGVVKEAKINTKNLYPYEILEKYSGGGYFNLGHKKYQPDLEAMWSGLKDWVGDSASNMIVISDTSGSMTGRPMAISVGLGIYFAERNKGAFHNKFMTFSSTPSWITLRDGMTLSEKIGRVPEIVQDTNIEAAFDLILDVAVKNNVPKEEMPSTLVIITDMEFNHCVVNNSCADRWSWSRVENPMSFYDKMVIKYRNAGYDLPKIAFWNVNARNDTFHATAQDARVCMVSGSATSVFKSLLQNEILTPVDFMLKVLSNERYNCVVVK